MTPVISVSVYNNAGTTFVGTMHHALDVQWLDEARGDGSFSFSVPYEDAAALEIQQIVKFAYGATSRSFVFAGVIETISYDAIGATDGGEDRLVTVSGRGVRSLLQNIIVYPASWPYYDGNFPLLQRQFAPLSPGAIMRQFLIEANSRGADQGLTTNFTDYLDTMGLPFDDMYITHELGSTLAEVANMHEDQQVDVHVTPDLVLEYYRDRGTDLTETTNPVTFRVGHNVTALSFARTGPIVNSIAYSVDNETEHYFGGGPQTGSTSVARFGRRESYMQHGSTLTEAILAYQFAIARTGEPLVSYTVEVVPRESSHPYIDWNVGDWVWIVDRTGAKTKLRVSSISVTMDADGAVRVVPELGNAALDLDRRLTRALARIEGDNARGTVTAKRLS